MSLEPCWAQKPSFCLREVLTIIYDSMQLGELNPNITLVFHQNVSVFAKLTIRGQKSDFLENLWFRFCSLMQHGAMANDRSHIEK
jgi:hypothetical protein